MWKFSRTKCAGGNPPLLTGIAAAPLMSSGGTGNTICLDSSLAESSGYIDWEHGMVLFFMLCASCCVFMLCFLRTYNNLLSIHNISSVF